jgi:hypothetical protein
MRQGLLGIAAAAAVLATTASPALADADSLVEHLGPAETGVGEARRAGALGALSTRLNPAGLPLSSELVFDGGYSYRPDAGASVVSLAACDSTNAMPGCFYYTYVGADETDGMDSRMRSHAGGITLSKAISERVAIGAGVKYFDVEVEGMDLGSGVNWDLGTTVQLTDMINLGLVGYNLWGAESAQFPRGVGAGALLRPAAPVSISFDAVWNLDRAEGEKTGRYGGGVEYFFTAKRGQQGYPVRLGALHDVVDGPDGGTHITGGLGFATMKFGLDVAARKQVSGGEELLILAAIRLYGPRQPQQ